MAYTVQWNGGRSDRRHRQLRLLDFADPLRAFLDDNKSNLKLSFTGKVQEDVISFARLFSAALNRGWTPDPLTTLLRICDTFEVAMSKIVRGLDRER